MLRSRLSALPTPNHVVLGSHAIIPGSILCERSEGHGQAYFLTRAPTDIDTRVWACCVCQYSAHLIFIRLLNNMIWSLWCTWPLHLWSFYGCLRGQTAHLASVQRQEQTIGTDNHRKWKQTKGNQASEALMIEAIQRIPSFKLGHGNVFTREVAQFQG